MREDGLEQAIRAAGSSGALARGLGISQPAVSAWQRVPAERVVAVEALTGVPRVSLRPDLYREGLESAPDDREVDDVDMLRAREYALLAGLLLRAPDRVLLGRLAGLVGDESPLGAAHTHLARAAATADPGLVEREFFDLFIGLGRGELLPYGSYYLTGFLNERPLARLRTDLARLGVERAPGLCEPEDHIGILCEVMAGLAGGAIEAGPGAERRFFDRHVEPWAGRLFADLERARAARFYTPVATLGRLFIAVESEAFAMAA